MADAVEVIGPYKVHPLASQFPAFGKRDLKELMEDIKENGLHNPIVITKDDQLLDGRNRLRACLELGIKVKDIPKEVVDDNDEPTLYRHVWGLNFVRRQLSDSQKVAMRRKYLADTGKLESDEDTAKATGAKVPTVRRVKALPKEKQERLVKGEAPTGRGRPKGGGPPRRVILDREEMTPKQAAAVIIEKWNDAPRSYVANLISQLSIQWNAVEHEEEAAA